MPSERMILWPTVVSFWEIPSDEARVHNEVLEELVVREASTVHDTNQELRLHDMQEHESPSVQWLVDKVQVACREYCGLPRGWPVDVELRGVVLTRGLHINTHTEASESDLAVSYWPSGDYNKIGTPINENGNSITEPTFVLEDPSRHISDFRLPFDERHSVCVCPRPGLLTVFPAHLPHNVHPYMGDTPFVQIVAQVRLNLGKEYTRRKS
jgi:hypothetical protein